MKTLIKVKTCPKCNKEPVFTCSVNYGSPNFPMYQVLCHWCGHRGPEDNTEQGSYVRWNGQDAK